MGHAELVPIAGLGKPCSEVFYLPMHTVHKEKSSTSKVRVMLDAFAKTASGTLLNNHLFVGPTVHPTIIDILLHFQRHRVALTTDVNRMYRAVLLPKHQHDLHWFMCSVDSRQPLKDYRIWRLTFGVSVYPFTTITAMRQNALDHQWKYPLTT